MANQLQSSDELLAYVRRISLREDDVLRELREETAAYPAGSVMAEEGQLLALLVGLTGARSVLEIGTFTGYSALRMARALPPGGQLVTCDIHSPRCAEDKPFVFTGISSGGCIAHSVAAHLERDGKDQIRPIRTEVGHRRGQDLDSISHPGVLPIRLPGKDPANDHSGIGAHYAGTARGTAAYLRRDRRDPD
jgi:hypothetical protein